MNRYVATRLLQIPPQLLILVTLTFFVIRLAPGTPGVTLAQPSEAIISEKMMEQLRAYWGLDQPLHVQYLRWLRGIVTFDFGTSYITGRPVLDEISERFVATLVLTSSSFLIGLLGIPLGVIAARKRYSWFDHSATLFAFGGISIPSFWLAIMLILIFAVQLGWLPASGIRLAGEAKSPGALLRHLILPALTLAVGSMAPLLRYVRSSVLESLAEDYVRTAHAKGLPDRTVLFRHVIKNSLLPAVTILGLSIPGLIGGSTLVETVFGWPGMGRLAVDSALHRDYPITMALVVFTGSLTIAGNLLADLCYGLLDPRIRAA